MENNIRIEISPRQVIDAAMFFVEEEFTTLVQEYDEQKSDWSYTITLAAHFFDVLLQAIEDEEITSEELPDNLRKAIASYKITKYETEVLEKFSELMEIWMQRNQP